MDLPHPRLIKLIIDKGWGLKHMCSLRHNFINASVDINTIQESDPHVQSCPPRNMSLIQWQRILLILCWGKLPHHSHGSKDLNLSETIKGMKKQTDRQSESWGMTVWALWWRKHSTPAQCVYCIKFNKEACIVLVHSWNKEAGYCIHIKEKTRFICGTQLTKKIGLTHFSRCSLCQGAVDGL